jgi:hypothetical protein
MKARYFIPVAVLALAVACSDTATSPTSGARPLFLTAGNYGAVTTLNAAGAPGGAKINTRGAAGTVTCTVASATDQSITCSGNGDYQISGVGGTNASAALAAHYSATVTCTNNGGSTVEVKTQDVPKTGSTGQLSPKNGKLTVPQIDVSTPTVTQLKAAATCPNPTWRKDVVPGSPNLDSFDYDVFFFGFGTAAIHIDETFF